MARLLAVVALLFASQAPPKDDDFPVPKKLSLTLSNSTLKAAADRLGKDGGYVIRLGECDPKTKVSIKVDKAPFVEALGALCRAAGVSYRWIGTSVELSPDFEAPKTSTGTRMGPFSMEAWVALWNKDIPALYCNTDWEPGVAAAWYFIKLDSVLGPNGDPITLPREEREWEFDGFYTHNSKIMGLTRGDGNWKRDFFPLPVGTTKLKSISGTVAFAFPAKKPKTIRFENPGGKSEQMVDGFPLTLEIFPYDVKTMTWSARLDVEVLTAPMEKRLPLYGLLAGHRLRFFAKGGAATPNLSLGGGGTGGSRTNGLRDIHIKGYCKVPDGAPLAAVEVEFDSDVVLKTYPFEIKDVPFSTPKK